MNFQKFLEWNNSPIIHESHRLINPQIPQIPHQYKTPIKQTTTNHIVLSENNQQNSSQFDLNSCFVNLFSPGQLLTPLYNNSYFFSSNAINNSGFLVLRNGNEVQNSENTLTCYPHNVKNENHGMNSSHDKINTESNENIRWKERNKCSMTKRNLCNWFDKVENSHSTNNSTQNNFNTNTKHFDTTFNGTNCIQNINTATMNIILTTPAKKRKERRFACLSLSFKRSTNLTEKKRRWRKDKFQISKWIKFHKNNPNWTRKNIKEFSKEIGLEMSKVYKWLWDKRNKNIKKTWFVVNNMIEMGYRKGN